MLMVIEYGGAIDVPNNDLLCVSDRLPGYLRFYKVGQVAYSISINSGNAFYIDKLSGQSINREIFFDFIRGTEPELFEWFLFHPEWF